MCLSQENVIRSNTNKNRYYWKFLIICLCETVNYKNCISEL